MKNSKLNKIVLCCMLFAMPIIANADDITDPEADIQDTAAAPIDDYLPLAFVAGIGLSYVFLRRRKTRTN